MLLTFLTTLIAYSIKINRLDTFNNKKPIISSRNFDASVFWGSKWSMSEPISRQSIWYIPNIKNSEFKLKNDRFFQKPFYFSFSFLDNDSHKFWDQSPSLNISVVCKNLRHFLGTSFVVATLTTCCNIEYREAAWFISAK